MLFADLLSLHLVTFLMFFILVVLVIVGIRPSHGEDQKFGTETSVAV